MTDRQTAVRRGLRLEYLTLGYNVVEAVVSMVSGVLAGSIALVGFGVDAVIESISGSVMLWRLKSDDHHKREEFEQRALKLIGASFLVLAAYVGYEAVERLWTREAPERSIPGIVIACCSLAIMPVLARRKRAVGHEIQSAAMVADSRQTELCSWLSAILLGGLVLNAAMGWWWADPVAGLLMVPIIAREGVSALRGQGCHCHGQCH
ncbi:MAG: cation transporter [Acidobacteria bacterium]|nr:cation transporter [Acidobacteriota bacterium]